MNTNTKIGMGALAVVLVAASFYGGTLYGKTGVQFRGQSGNGFGGQFQNRSEGAFGVQRGAGVVTGEILSKDESAMTVKLPDGSTKIVLIASSTRILTSAEGTLSDLVIGKNVLVTGTTNSDGSVSGENIQIRPEGTMPFGGQRRIEDAP